MTQKLVIPVLLPSLNDYIRLCRGNARQANRAKRAADETVMWCCIGQKLKRVSGRVRLHIRYYDRDNRIDPDNRAFSKKFLLDGMVRAGVMTDDARRNLVCPVPWTEEFLIDRARPRIEVLIEEVE
jgi:hypothetical protein